MIGTIHKGDIGTAFELVFRDETDTAIDIHLATTKEIMFRKANGLQVTKAGTFSTNGIDGRLKYTTLSGDLNFSGTWKIQGHVVLPSGEWKTDVSTFTVWDDFTDTTGTLQSPTQVIQQKSGFAVAQSVTAGVVHVSFPDIATSSYGVEGYVLLSDGTKGLTIPKCAPFTETRTSTGVDVIVYDTGTLYTFIILP